MWLHTQLGAQFESVTDSDPSAINRSDERFAHTDPADERVRGQHHALVDVAEQPCVIVARSEFIHGARHAGVIRVLASDGAVQQTEIRHALNGRREIGTMVRGSRSISTAAVCRAQCPARIVCGSIPATTTPRGITSVRSWCTSWFPAMNMTESKSSRPRSKNCVTSA